MNIDIICPIFNGEKYIDKLNTNLLLQKNVAINSINYILTESNDNSEKILKELNCKYTKIKPENFSHSLTREKAGLESKAGILVFITQDIEIRNEDWLEKLVEPIISGEAVASYSRQLTKYNNIEKYTREHNYPNKSIIKSKNDIEALGLNTFFFSDASSAVKTAIFKELNAYDGKNLPINEDMYIAYKIIMNGYKIKYCADSIVYHSHKFTLKQLYKRYYDTGKFFKQNNYLDKFGTNKSGGGLAKYILKRAIQDKNLKVLIRYIPDMAVRFIGMKMGKKKE